MVWEPNPARDAAGNVVPHDDPETVPGEWTLLRHIHPEQWTRDGRTGAPRPQSIAFAFSTEGSRRCRTAHACRGASSHSLRKGVARVTAAKAHELDLRVGP